MVASQESLVQLKRLLYAAEITLVKWENGKRGFHEVEIPLRKRKYVFH